MGNVLTREIPEIKDRPVIEEIFIGNLNESLCSSCEYSDKCQYLASTMRGVLFCEEYSSGPAAAVEINRNIAREPDVSENIRGLCRNCAERFSCKLVKKQTDVWFCEEYR